MCALHYELVFVCSEVCVHRYMHVSCSGLNRRGCVVHTCYSVCMLYMHGLYTCVLAYVPVCIMLGVSI